MASVAFAASLLPARFLAENGGRLNVTRIVVVVPGHERSYAYVAQHIPGAAVVRLRGSRLRRILGLALELLRTKLKGDEVLFFHECSWPEFDVVVAALRPRGAFYPQVSMTPGFEAIARREWPAPTTWPERVKRAAFAGFSSNFDVYRSPKLSGAEGYDYFLSWRCYPTSIHTFPPPAHMSNSVNAPSNAVLFIVGKESVADEYLRSVYEDLIGAARRAGLTVFVKDHPVFSLGLRCDDCEQIDPAVPAELLDRPFAFAVGIASTALASVGARRISLVKALNALPPEVKRMRIDYLTSLGGTVEYVDTLDDMRGLFAAHASQSKPARAV